MSESADKPRVRVQAGSDKHLTADNFVNFRANLGYGTNNLQSGGTYNFNPVTRNHTMLEWMYRGSWIVGMIIDAVADDMTRAGARIKSDMKPESIAKINETIEATQVWSKLNDTIKWARLYGGAIAVIMIEGQKPETPLRLDTIGKNQFKGLLVLDRWMVWPHLEDLVSDLGKDFGKPRYYETVVDAKTVPRMKVHYSRVIRMEGIQLPYYQYLAENMWGLSVVERLFDRLIAFDSATTGAAQLVYRAHLRTYYVEKLRELIATGGRTYQAFLQQMNLIRATQSIEGMTILDSADKFEVQQYTFAGLDSILIQFGQQISGACQIPLVRLFGQSPVGLNSTGESDFRNYYDAIRSQQKVHLSDPLRLIYDVVCRSRLGIPLPEGFTHDFIPLWQLQEQEKAAIASQVTTTVLAAKADAIISDRTVLKELRQSSEITGIWTNITDEDIANADPNPPVPQMQEGEGAPGEPPQPGSGDPGEVAEPDQEDPGDAGELEQEQELETHEDELPDDREDTSMEPLDTSGNEGDVGTYRVHNGAEAEGVPLDGSKTLPGYRMPTRQQRRRFARRQALRMLSHDHLSVREIQGIICVIETAKGTRRLGYGWAVQMPTDYGYISGTSSAEGPTEQMDCYIGPETDSSVVYIIHQVEPDRKMFDEHKVMLGYKSRQDAINDYHAAFSDGRGPERVGNIVAMSVTDFKKWLSRWRYGQLRPDTKKAA